jgi:cytoskeletal protein RodZ
LESLGNKLKLTRESRNETYDEVSFKINVASRYLKALEAEDFSVFPGEVYMLGFMKNYGEYLGLNIEDLTKLYSSMKLQEQPTPTELLKPQRRKFPVKSFLTTLGVIGVLAVIGFILYFVSENYSSFEISVPKTSRKVKDWMVDSFPSEKRLFVNDSFIVPYKDSEYKLTLISVEDTLSISSDNTDVISINLGVGTPVDLDADGFNDVKITALDFVKNKPSTGARLSLELDDSIQIASQTAAQAQPQTQSASEAQVSILSSPTPYPFTLQVVFQDYCLFRWEILAESNRPGRNEQYFERNKELSIQAQNGIRIGISNAAAAKIQAIGGGKQMSLELGGFGEVVVADVRWIKEEENRYRLVLALLE